MVDAADDSRLDKVIAGDQQAGELSTVRNARKRVIEQLDKNIPDIGIIEQNIAFLEKTIGSRAYDSCDLTHDPKNFPGRSILSVMHENKSRTEETTKAIGILTQRLIALHASETKQNRDEARRGAYAREFLTHILEPDSARKKRPSTQDR